MENKKVLTVYPEISSLAGSCQVFTDVSMKTYSSMKVGGKADVLIEINHLDSLALLLRFLSEREIPTFVMGNGSNLIVSDEGYHGVILRIAKGLSEISVSDDILESAAGNLLAVAAKVAYDHGLAGMEFASGIPGTLGGALAMNAGAYDGEMKDIVLSVECMDMVGKRISLDKESLGFGYRKSILQTESLIAISAKLKLKHGDPEIILKRMMELSKKRSDKQPLTYPSCGSTFKRPVGYFAGKLIEDSGLKGLSVGGAQVSEKHSGFIINTGNATASDVVELVRLVRERVYMDTGVVLEPEVKWIGGEKTCSF